MDDGRAVRRLAEDDTIHPRPQLTRARWIDLGGPWRFAYDDDNRGMWDGWQDRDDVFPLTITVPYPPESPASGIGDPGFHPVVWYRRVVAVGPEDRVGRLLLHCGAVDYRAHVWVNGKLVATHEGGHTPFTADITSALLPGEEQVIVIRAEDMPTDLAQPRGKQDWERLPHQIWYERTTGIWQPVWLEPVPVTYITSVRWTPDLDRGVLGLSLAVQRGDERPLQLRLRLTLHDVELVDDSYGVSDGTLQREVALDLGSLTMSTESVLWSVEHPNLIHATLTLLSDGQQADEVESYAALRSVGVIEGRFLLNQRPQYLRMALEQGYWPQSHLAAPSSAALRREVEIAKELGFNGLRIHQKVEDPRFLYWCDRLGLMIWGEMPNAYVFSPTSNARLTREWMEVVERDYSHPCIVAWVPINESWGVPNLLRDPAQQHFVQAMYHLTKALDRTRPVVANDGWEYLVGDIFGIHDYTFSGDMIRERYGNAEAVERTLREVLPSYRLMTLPGNRHQGNPIMITEFGGISYRPKPGRPWAGYGTVTDARGYLEKYRELLYAVLDCTAITGYCYTQLTDTAQETNGLVTENREFKLDPASVREINRRGSRAMAGAPLVAQMEQVQGTGFPSSTSLPHPPADEGDISWSEQQDG
jgi:hypothetical protein